MRIMSKVQQRILVQYQKSWANNNVPYTMRFHQRVMEEDRQQAEMEEFERILKKNKQGNYGLFAEKCDHCIDGPIGGSVLSSESSIRSITLEKPYGSKLDQRGSVFDQKESVSNSHNKMFSKGRD